MDNTSKTGKKKTPLIKGYLDMSTDTTVDIEVTFPKGAIDKMLVTPVEYGCNQLEKVLKMYTTNTTTNMHAFNHEEKLKKYDTVYDIVDDYMKVRILMYTLRKEFLIRSFEREVMLLSNKARYIGENLEGTVDLRRKKKDIINKMLADKKYDIIDNDKDYKYLVKMPMDSVSEENIKKLLKEKDDKEAELEIVKKTTEKQMWLKELKTLEKQYTSYREKREEQQKGLDIKTKKKVVKKVKKIVTKKK